MTIIEDNQRLDLNLLRVLAALGQWEHVGRAAESLGMSQSGFSSALARLRKISQDVLFVRTGGGMVPTARARTMIEAARRALAAVEEGIAAIHQFDPATSRAEFRLAMPDVGEFVFLPTLIGQLQRSAPHVTVTTDDYQDRPLASALASGEADFALGYYPDLASSAFRSDLMYYHTYVCIARANHPLVKKRLTLPLFSSLGHAVVTAPSRSAALFDDWLRRNGIERRIVIKTTHNLSLPLIIESTDLIATVPLAVGVRFAKMGAVRLAALPFRPDVFQVRLHWHRNFENDPRRLWLRQTIHGCFSPDQDEWLPIERALYEGDLRGE